MDDQPIQIHAITEVPGVQFCNHVVGQLSIYFENDERRDVKCTSIKKSYKIMKMNRYSKHLKQTKPAQHSGRKVESLNKLRN